MSYFITSIPKSGTHLLATVVKDVTGTYPETVKKLSGRKRIYPEYKPTENLVGHFRTKAIRNIESLSELFAQRRVLALVRDPRAICNSMLHHLRTSHSPIHIEGWGQLKALPFNEQIIQMSKGLYAADGREIVAEITKMCEGISDITTLYPDAVVIRYEDFFDPEFVAGRLPAIFGIDAQRARDCVDRALAGDSRTKREGNPTGWRTAWDTELVDYFNGQYGKLVTDLGYSI